MNICLLTSTFLPLVGGLEIVVHNLATALSKLGHNVFLVTPYPEFKRKIIDNYSYRVIRFGFRGVYRLKLVNHLAFITLAYTVKRYKIDVINVHNIYSAGSWAYFFNKTNGSIPIIGTPHGDDVQITLKIHDGARLDPVVDKTVRRNLSRFSLITSLSASIREDLYNLGVDKRRIRDVPNGVRTNIFKKDINSSYIREKFGVPLDSIAIISVGRNHPRKGFAYGLEAIAKLRKLGYNISYIIIGRNMEPIVEKAKTLSISNFLITPGQVDNHVVSNILQSSDIYFSPSIVESFGVATLEAMNAGLPCVATDIAGSRDLVSPDYGFLVTPEDPEEMCTALKFLIENPEKRKEMGRKARSEALRYDWQNIAEQYLNVYNEALNFRNRKLSSIFS